MLLLILFFFGRGVFASALQTTNPPPHLQPIPQIAVGQCGDRAFQIVADLANLNGDSIVTTSDNRDHRLEADKPQAALNVEADKTEIWQISQNYRREEKRGIIILRKVIYDVEIIADPSGFCTIKEVKRIDKHDYFREIK